MGQMVQLSDDKGFFALPGVVCGHPVGATGQALTNAAADTDGTVNVVAGRSYLVTALNTGGFYFGALTVATAANVLWVCPLHKTVLIHIDEELFGVARGDTVALHFATDTNDGIGKLVQLALPKHMS
jgi:hypothetical protein